MASRNKKTRASDGHGGWFELVVFVFMSGIVYLIGTLIDNPWTGTRGQATGEYLRGTGGGALIVPLLFLLYLCIAWFARSRIPRPLGQIFGTLQLYFSTAFILGLFRHAGGNLSWALAEPGRVGNALSNFFILNLGALGTIIMAVVAFAVAAILFGSKLPISLFRFAAARFVEKKPERGVRERKARERGIREMRERETLGKSPVPRGETPTSVTAAAVPDEDLLPLPERESVLTSTPIDGLVIVGDDLVNPNDYAAKPGLGTAEAQPDPALQDSAPEAPAEEPPKTETLQIEEIEKTEKTEEVFAASPFSKLEPDLAEKVPEVGKNQTATGILEELLASLEAEKPLVESSKFDFNSDSNPKPREYKPPLPSAAVLDPEQIIEIQAQPELTLNEQVLELKNLLGSSPPSLSPEDSGKNFGKDLGVRKNMEDDRGLSSAVQEAFPDVNLPREEEDVEPLLSMSFPPPLDIFGPAVKNEDEDNGYALANEQAKTIVETLQNFGVKSNVAHIVIGPSVVQFQLELAPGIKVSKVSGLANDLTMALAVVSVRVEAPILGQRYVGIEIPNTKRKGITLRSIMESEEFQQSDYRLPLPMGVRVDSKHLVCGLEDMPHLLVAGTT